MISIFCSSIFDILCSLGANILTGGSIPSCAYDFNLINRYQLFYFSDKVSGYAEMLHQFINYLTPIQFR
ncbi:Hypothetical protein LUCI_4443 [Lucifera butyrica]|uniref:Uncharacterized protein n=1 Tax=Lucifera butyrica TaxID=1351585 RepID=A0A498RE00_9FIRM|nr:Hypothetical protein LUCI_4443 [Lucifera butyrica]